MLIDFLVVLIKFKFKFAICLYYLDHLIIQFKNFIIRVLALFADHVIISHIAQWLSQ